MCSNLEMGLADNELAKTRDVSILRIFARCWVTRSALSIFLFFFNTEPKIPNHCLVQTFLSVIASETRSVIIVIERNFAVLTMGKIVQRYGKIISIPGLCR